MDPITLMTLFSQQKNSKSSQIVNEAKALKEELKNMSPQEQEAFWADIEGCEDQDDLSTD
jgi:hypothetical protein